MSTSGRDHRSSFLVASWCFLHTGQYLHHNKTQQLHYIQFHDMAQPWLKLPGVIYRAFHVSLSPNSFPHIGQWQVTEQTWQTQLKPALSKLNYCNGSLQHIVSRMKLLFCSTHEQEAAWEAPYVWGHQHHAPSHGRMGKECWVFTPPTHIGVGNQTSYPWPKSLITTPLLWYTVS